MKKAPVSTHRLKTTTLNALLPAAVRPKLLHVVESTSAGVGKHVVDLMAALDIEKFDLALAYSPLRADSLFVRGTREAARRGVKLFEIPMRRDVSPKADLASFRQLRALLANGKFDIVHTHGSKAGFLGRMAAKSIRQAPLTLYTPHAISLSFNRKYWLPEKLAGFFTDGLIAVSQSERNGLGHFHLVPRSKLFCVTAGVDLEAVQRAAGTNASALRRELKIDAGEVIVGTVGRIAHQKDPHTFLRALPLLLRQNHKVHFVWVGDGEQKEDLQNEARNLGVADRMHFLGYRTDVPRLLAGFDIFALTSRYESFGYVTCEAMSLAKPVVATAVEGTIELVDNGVTGWLCRPQDAASFAGQVARLLSHPGAIKTMGEAGLERAKQKFRLGRMVSDTERLYRHLLTENGRSLDVSLSTDAVTELSFAAAASGSFPVGMATEKEAR